MHMRIKLSAAIHQFAKGYKVLENNYFITRELNTFVGLRFTSVVLRY